MGPGIAILLALLAWPALAQGSVQAPAGAVSARPPARPEQADRATMQFDWVREGGECRERCRSWIAASGRITETTVADFEAFVAGLDVRGATVALDSGGGLVDGGLALGRAFRRLGLATTVGRTMRLAPDASGERRATLSPRATCASMCVFALLGGVRRQVPDEARVLVHQIWPSKLREDAVSATYSAANLVRIQRELGQIARYTVEMGGDIELFELSVRIPPWETLRPLTREELRRMHVHNSDQIFGGAPVAAPLAPAAPAAPVAPAATATPARSAASAASAASSAAVPTRPAQRLALATDALDLPRGWTVTRQGGRAALIRRHPLTVEGQDIGSFEISFTCGDKPDSYQVSYGEKRMAAASDRLDGVRMMIRRDPISLKVESSEAASSSELVSSARGLVPGAVARALAADAGASLLVETVTAGRQRTGIRIGPAGLTEGFREIAAGCSK